MPVSIEVKDIGPIVEFEYTMEKPGLSIVRGHQGAGKTTILRTAQLATDGRTDVKPTQRDGSKRGEATVAGRTLRITKRVQEDGELTVDGLGDLNIADLHTPKFVDAKTRDKHRIKTLVRLTGVKADATLFHPLLKDAKQFDEVVGSAAIETDDLVDMAANIKRRLESAAQEQEKQQETAATAMRIQAAQYEGLDMDQPSNEEMLRSVLADAVAEHARLEERAKNADATLTRAAEAKKKLDASEAIVSVSTATKNLEAARELSDEAQKVVSDLEKKLAAAKAALDKADETERMAKAALQSAEREAALTQQLRDDIAAAEKVEKPTATAIAEASAMVDEASKAVSDGMKIRQAKAAVAEHDRLASLATKHGKQAHSFRQAAAETQDILSASIASIAECPLKVKMDGDDSRLVVETDRAKDELFEDLSDGEKWGYVVGIAAKKNRLIVLPQAAFGELSPESRKRLHELAIEHECYILTAQSDDGKLRAEPFVAK